MRNHSFRAKNVSRQAGLVGAKKFKMTKAAAKNRKVQPQISNAKKAKVSGEKAPILPIEKQNLIIKNVFDRLDGRSVILHGIEKTKS